MKSAKPILVSACLAGVNCKYNGKSRPAADVVELVENGEAVMVCPEQLAGFPTPRPPAEIKNNRVIEQNGKDVTDDFDKGAEEALKIAKMYGCKKAILCGGSPTCGVKTIYDGTFSGNKIKGSGVFAKVLEKEGLELEER